MRLTVVIDCHDPEALEPFWAAALGYRPAQGPPGWAALVPPDGETGPVVLLQAVPEAKSVKNRVHLDVHPDDPAAHVARLEALGARRLGGWVDELADEAGVRWLVLADPEGNELCVVEHLR
ncbi:MAG TPA: VOC family protein [Angustibacter sp.]|nr:VOC family protein [Angustibacter sp.]